ncbi:MAG TPA: tRNA (adenosine(37)-N6)-threonylcarbamoyltransferase complex dimerization subunit type 1 TsaB [Phycisphaerae bacterium]|nr:tRNA (adenosine(37)-N6)-threonylcarbamoyltransferase complex dimerization subunit type 1 TsaB [Phycisphaerae bacterium]
MDSARILLMDTSGKTGAVGLATGTEVLTATHLPGVMRHAAELLPTIETLLRGVNWAPDSLTDVFLTIGPGSFTGLRLGVSVARTLAWSAGARIVAVPTLDVLARNALAENPPPHVAVVLDAKRGQAFMACFEHRQGQYVTVLDACLDEPRAFLVRCPRPLAVLGEGLAVHGPAVAESGAVMLPPERWPGRAEHVFALGIQQARAGGYTPPGDLVPRYIRRPEMEERWEKRQAQLQAGPTGEHSH